MTAIKHFPSVPPNLPPQVKKKFCLVTQRIPADSSRDIRPGDEAEVEKLASCHGGQKLDAFTCEVGVRSPILIGSLRNNGQYCRAVASELVPDGPAG